MPPIRSRSRPTTRSAPSRSPKCEARMKLSGIVSALGLLTALAWAQPQSTQPTPSFFDPMRGPTPVNQLTEPPPLGIWVNDDERRPRNFDKQPPTIPHRIDGYQIDRNFNKCLDCHAR